MEWVDDETPAPKVPTSTPPPAGRADKPLDSILAPRREPTMEELLGINPPSRDGVNGPAVCASGNPPADRPRDRSDAARSVKK